MIPGNQASGGKFIDPPSAVTGVVNALGNAEVTITHTGYKGKSGSVRYRVIASNGVTASTNSASVAISSGLTAGATYTFTAVAIDSTSETESPVSTSSSAVVLGTVPSAPATPTVSLPSTYGNTTASVSWSAPASVGSEISDYTVQYSSNSGSTWTTFSRAASTATSVTVTGLTNGTAYIFRVNAINGIGTGSYSSSSSSVTPLFGKLPTPIVSDIAETTNSIPWCYDNWSDQYTYVYYGGCCGNPNDIYGSCHGWFSLGENVFRDTYVYASQAGWANSDSIYLSETTNIAPVVPPVVPVVPPVVPCGFCGCTCCAPNGCVDGGSKVGVVCVTPSGTFAC